MDLTFLKYFLIASIQENVRALAQRMITPGCAGYLSHPPVIKEGLLLEGLKVPVIITTAAAGSFHLNGLRTWTFLTAGAPGQSLPSNLCLDIEIWNLPEYHRERPLNKFGKKQESNGNPRSNHDPAKCASI